MLKTEVTEGGWSYNFPIENNSDYKAKVQFRAIQESYAGLWDAGVSVVSSQISPNVPNESFFPNRDLAKKAAQQSIDVQKHKGINYSQKLRNSKTNKGSVELFLPQSIQIADKIDYTQPELGMLGGAAFMGARAAAMGANVGVGTMMDAGSKMVGQTLGALFNGNLGNTATSLAVQRAAQKASMPEVAGAVASATGIAVNPNKRNILNGIALRSFRFTFKLIPRTAEESQRIKDIIYFFRKNMYPSLTDDSKIFNGDDEGIGATTAGNEILNFEGMSAGLEYPCKWEIDMYYLGEGVYGETWTKIGTEILPCFLESFEAVYNPNTMAFHTDGSPQEVDISLTFVEERAMNATDIKKPAPLESTF
jgi:hypothetical protein